MYLVDITIFSLIHNLSGKFFLLDWPMIFFARWMPYLLVFWFFWLLIRHKNKIGRYYILFFAALSAITSRGIITPVIRYFYDRPRPFDVLGFNPLIPHEGGGSFPSGHMAFYFALVLVFFMFSRKVGVWYLLFVVLMGIARIYAGVHWPSDILGGTLIALLASLVVYAALPRSPLLSKERIG